ncbi:uncharacterized protein LOC120475643 [Pimephales promelas]|uniref:uncharacterized protein LOC120475643 n=1 Tax=Pimephales promelas TaxID=90988 RepID=UPI001955D1A3|nr:uncharacterized protein LOC120475643 [Pimephales promelas]
MPKKIFEAFIFFYWCGVFGVDAVKSVSVTEGESVTLNTDTEKQKDELIMWRTVHNDSLIAKIKGNNFKTDVLERFRDRLTLDEKTGSLTITNTRTTDSGLYKVTIDKSVTPLNTFNLTVYARLPVPVINHSSKQSSSSSLSSSSSSNCSLLCSVLIESDATLSWYKGVSVLSSISVSHLSRNLSLHLECLDDAYSCVLNNTISNQTTHLNTELCGPCSGADFNCWCGFTEAVIRLALSALVGVAAVAVLVYEFRSRSLQQKKRAQTPSNSD